MPRKQKPNAISNEMAIKAGVVVVGILCLKLGARNVLGGVIGLVATILAVLVALGIAWVLVKNWDPPSPVDNSWQVRPVRPDAAAIPPSQWTRTRVIDHLHSIDWYQFEKLNAVILQKEGWTVERKGGATPDGGVDLIAIKNGKKMLVQCKHWKTWRMQERVVREMLGSMTHFGATLGAIHTLKGWTVPAAKFAAAHGIVLCDQQDLAIRACASLIPSECERLLGEPGRHCPKCEALMVRRTGPFKAFWGCSTYPRCRGTLRET